MKTNNNSSHIDNLLSSIINKEKESVGNNRRVNLIMDKINALTMQASFENQRFAPRVAFVYGLSIAASVLVGCIIGNMACTSVNTLQVSTETFDLINIGFNSLVLPF